MKKTVKHLLVSILAASSLCTSIPLSASAATVSPQISENVSSGLVMVDQTVEHLADGGYITIEIYESPSLSRAISQKQGRKVVTQSDSNGKMVWQYTLSATFSVNSGVSATCTKVTGTPSIYDTAWFTVSNTPNRSGNRATGNITMQNRTSKQKVSRSVTLTCDAYGNLS